jgi:hypothetical protein
VKKLLVVVVLLSLALFSRPASSAEGGKKGASSTAYEHASDQAIFHRVTDWFATIGKSEEEKVRIREERRLKREEKRAEQEAKRLRKEERKAKEEKDRARERIRTQRRSAEQGTKSTPAKTRTRTRTRTQSGTRTKSRSGK